MTAAGTAAARGRNRAPIDRDRGSAESDPLRKLLAPGIKLILIKGAPGTGKTSLAFRLLEYLESGTYISSRVGLQKLSEQNPRLLRIEKKGRLNQVNLETTPSEMTTLKKGGVEEAATVMLYDDVRLGNPTLILSQVMKAATSNRELIILDSWDTMAKEMDYVDRLRAERSIAAVVDGCKDSRVVLISEEPEQTSTDYLVDAIVTLGYVELGHLRLREITWEKLRGQPILDRKRIFTLKDGRVALMAKPDLLSPNPRRFQPIPNCETHYSTGSGDLDEFLGGGMRHGMNMLLEEGATVGNHWDRPLYGLIRSNFLLNGGGCIMVPSPMVTPTMVIEATAPHVGMGVLRSGLRIVSHLPHADWHPSVLDVSGKGMDEVFQVQNTVVEQLRRQGHPHVLWLLDMDTYEIFAGADVRLTNYMARGTAIVRQTGDVHIMMAKPSTAGLQMLSDNYDIHLKLEEQDGTLILYGKRPPTDAYGVSYDFCKGYPQVSLTRIM